VKRLVKACVCASLFHVYGAQALSNESLVLICTGPYPTFENGMGSTLIDYREKVTRVFKINLISGIVSTVGNFGETVGSLRFRANEESNFSVVFPINRNWKSAYVYREEVLINRITGKASGMYAVMGKENMYAFDGECVVGKKKF
jgi:hypothetical protein